MRATIKLVILGFILIVLVVLFGGAVRSAVAQTAPSPTIAAAPVVSPAMPPAPAPIELTVSGIFRAIGPVRWGILPLTVMLLSITMSGLIFLAMPLSQRRTLAAPLTSLKEWNTIISTLCTTLGPIGTYIGMIGSLLAMYQVSIAVDTAAKLMAQAVFFQKAAQMFISSLAGIGAGITLGLINNLILHHVFPNHRHPIAGEGMVASTVAILSKWLKEGRIWQRRPISADHPLTATWTPEEEVKQDDEDQYHRMAGDDTGGSAGVSGGGVRVPLHLYRAGTGAQEPAAGGADDRTAATADYDAGEYGQRPAAGGQEKQQPAEYTPV